MYSFLNFIFLIIIIYIQSSIFARLDIWGIVPNLVFIFIIAATFFRSDQESYFLAFASGLIMDILYGGPFGLHTSILMLIVLVINLFTEKDEKKIAPLLPLLFLGISLFLFYLFQFSYIAFSTGRVAFDSIPFYLLQIASSVVLAVVLLPVVRTVFLLENEKEARG